MKSKTFMLLTCVLVLVVSSQSLAAELSGRFVYNGEPVSGLSVFLVPEEGELTGYEPRSITDAQGKYYFTGLAEGEYVLKTFGHHSNDYYNTVDGFWGTNTPAFSLQADGKYQINDLSIIKEMKIQEPVDSALVSNTKVTFKWEPLFEASYFVVQIYNTLGEKIHQSDAIYADEYPYDHSLNSGIYSWEVRAFNSQDQLIGRTPFSERRRLFSIGNLGAVPEVESVKIGADLVDDNMLVEKTSFTPEDTNVMVLVDWLQVEEEHMLIYKFFDPSGQQYHELPFIISAGIEKSYAWIDLQHHRAASHLGRWTVEVWVDQNKIDTLNFEIR